MNKYKFRVRNKNSIIWLNQTSKYFYVACSHYCYCCRSKNKLSVDQSADQSVRDAQNELVTSDEEVQTQESINLLEEEDQFSNDSNNSNRKEMPYQSHIEVTENFADKTPEENIEKMTYHNSVYLNGTEIKECGTIQHHSEYVLEKNLLKEKTVVNKRMPYEFDDGEIIGIVNSSNSNCCHENFSSAEEILKENHRNENLQLLENSSSCDESGSEFLSSSNEGSSEFSCDSDEELSNESNNVNKSNAEADVTREIVDFQYVSKKILEMWREHDDHNRCHGELWCYNRWRYGLRTLFYYSCTECDYKNTFWSENPDTTKKFGINKEAVLGTIHDGIGCTNLDGILRSMKVISMSDKTYKRDLNYIHDILKELAEDSMIEAGKEEYRLAEQENQMHEGTPWIYVVTDGSWITRSYGTNFSSPCGLGVIIGLRTGKVLHVGIKNNYCRNCVINASKNIDDDNHRCYKNWDEKVPSTPMESESILEGFQESIAKHNLIYKYIVTDGDSNVYKTLTDNNVYEDYKLVPVRIRCYNHLLRNLCGKLHEISNSNQPFGTQHITNFSTLKEVIENKINLIRKLIGDSVDFWRAQDADFEQQREGLEQDIDNISCHVFGDHTSCQNNKGFKCNQNENINEDEPEKNYVPDMESTGLFQKVSDAMKL